MSDVVFDLSQYPVQLGLGARVVPLEHFDGTMEWYQRYGEGHAADGTHHTVDVHAGAAVINPPGVWHTADVTEPCTCLFITAGEGTQHRPR
jgi:hypothetical protein